MSAEFMMTEIQNGTQKYWVVKFEVPKKKCLWGPYYLFLQDSTVKFENIVATLEKAGVQHY